LIRLSPKSELHANGSSQPSAAISTPYANNFALARRKDSDTARATLTAVEDRTGGLARLIVAGTPAVPGAFQENKAMKESALTLALTIGAFLALGCDGYVSVQGKAYRWSKAPKVPPSGRHPPGRSVHHG
jgi:hypothetical protein